VAQVLLDALAAEAMRHFPDYDAELGAILRAGYYRAAIEVVTETGRTDLAVGFLHAATRSMSAHAEDPNLHEEVRRLAKTLTQLAKSGPDRDDVREAREDAQDEISRLQDKAIARNTVTVQHLRYTIAFRHSLERVGEKWIESSTRSLREKVAHLDQLQKWWDRAINVMWSFCKGPETAAPVVLAGVGGDIAFDLGRDALNEKIERIQAALKERIAHMLDTKMIHLDAWAAHAFAEIGEGRFRELELQFTSLGALERAFDAQIEKKLGAEMAS
jgi:hypothetical protein